MNKSKNNKVIVLGITANWAFAAATVLFGLKKHLRNITYDVIIFHNGISPSDQKILSTIVPNISFSKFNDSLIKTESFTERFSKMTFARFECFSLLEKYDSVLWLDTDILIKRDISGIFSISKKPFVLYQRGVPLSEDMRSLDPFENYNLTCPGYNCGVFLFNNTLRNPDEVKKWSYNFLNKWADALSSADQPVLNLAIQEFNIPVDKLPEKFNCPPAQRNKETCIVHPKGNKYWEKRIDPIWDSYYRLWHKIGGSGPKLSSPRKRLFIQLLWRVGLYETYRDVRRVLRRIRG